MRTEFQQFAEHVVTSSGATWSYLSKTQQLRMRFTENANSDSRIMAPSTTKLLETSGKYWGVAAMPKGIAAMPHIAAILQQHLAMGIAAMLLQHCNCSCIAAVLLQCRVTAILPQWGHCCNTLCALQQSAMPQRIAATLRQ